MAGHDDEEQQKALLDLFRRDMRDRPGDLALIQMALFVIWRRRKEYDGNLVNAYVAVNGVSGALADEADRAMRERLSEAQRNDLLSIFVRLIRLGETGGVTRRIAPLDEFAGEKRRLVEDLARDDHGRLLLVGGDTAEIAHEALITQWGWLQNQINQHAAPIRQLAGVMEDAAGWGKAGEADKASQLANEGDAASYDALKRDHADWLTAPEAQFVDASRAAIEKQRKRDRRIRAGRGGGGRGHDRASDVHGSFLVHGYRERAEARKRAACDRERARVNSEKIARGREAQSWRKPTKAARWPRSRAWRATADIRPMRSSSPWRHGRAGRATTGRNSSDLAGAVARARRTAWAGAADGARSVSKAQYSAATRRRSCRGPHGHVRLWDARSGRQIGSRHEA